MTLLFEYLRSIIAILAVFSVTVFVHELGHFLFMKLFGVRVERFAIGFGKRLFGFQWGGTDFCLCAIPFGGYVKPVGMHSKEYEKMLAEEDRRAVAPSDGAPNLSADITDPVPSPAASHSLGEDVADEMAAMRNKAWWQKVIILSAGCAFNLLAAFFATFLLFLVGHYVAPPVPAKVEHLSKLEHLVDVRKGDEILQVNEVAIANSADAYNALEKAGTVADPTTVVLRLRRDGEIRTVHVPVHPSPDWPRHQDDIAAIANEKVNRAKDIPKILRRLTELRDVDEVPIKVRLAGGSTRETTVPVPALAGPLWFASALQFRMPAYIEGVLPNLPADKAGLRKGDTILSVAGNPVASSFEAREAIMARLNQPTELVIQRYNSKASTTETLQVQVLVSPNPLQPERGRIGIIFGLPQTELRQYGFFKSIAAGIERTGFAIRANWNALGTVFGSGNLSFIGENLGGPIAIGVMTAKAASQGWVDLVTLFVMFNVMLAIINIMPIPVLDGGHIVFATVEALMRRPIPVKVFVWVHNFFIILILGLAATLMLNDVIRNAWRVIGIFQ